MISFLADTTQAIWDTIVTLTLPFLFFVILGLVLRKRAFVEDVQRVLPETGLNIQLSLFNLVFTVPAIGIAASLAVSGLEKVNLILLTPQFWDSLPRYLVMLVAIFVGDFVGYWRHRLEHTPLLWPSHAVHHSDTQMTWFSLERFHPINRFTTFIIDGVALAMLGFPTYAVIANGVIRHYYGYFIHADLPWTYGKFGRIFVSPAMHRWHHAADPKAFNTNYATVFSIFDQAFGTWRVPGRCTVPLGVTDRMRPTLSGQLGYAFTPRAYRGLFRRPSEHDPISKRDKDNNH